MSRINTNVSALQAFHKLLANQSDLSVRLERLSSGLRINRGGDDPAGLIASESLRAEIRGLDAAIANSERAINVIATADAALAEVSALLLDIKALVVESANSGARSATEIQANQNQIDNLLESINKIANTTVFNGKKLLDGQLGYTVSGQNFTNIARLQVFGARIPTGSTLPITVQVTASAQTAALGIGTGGATGVSASGNLSSSNNVTLEIRGNRGTVLLNLGGGTSLSSIASTVNTHTNTTGVSAAASSSGLSFNSTGYGSDQFVAVRAISGTFTVNPGDTGQFEDRGRDATVLVNGQQASVRGLIASVRSNGLDLVADLSTTFGTAVGSTSFAVKSGGANFQIGPSVNTDGLASIGIPSITTSNLGNSIDGFLYALASGQSASIVGGNFTAAENIVSAAIEQVSVLSGRLGGFQANQLETNINSRRVALENVQASESAIRDTDYAEEVARLTRAQIVMQATTQMLAIANQLPQNVLALLR